MYNSYFGFSVSPFSVTPDPAFFYSNRVYEEAYATLRYGIEAKKAPSSSPERWEQGRQPCCGS